MVNRWQQSYVSVWISTAGLAGLHTASYTGQATNNNDMCRTESRTLKLGAVASQIGHHMAQHSSNNEVIIK